MAAPQPAPEDERNRESYLRWQRLALEQLGYAINILLTFSVGVIGFAVKMMIDSKTPFPALAHYMFHGWLVSLLVCVGSGIGATISRTLDYRFTRRAVRARWKGEESAQEVFHQKADVCGQWTWRFFPTQAGAFVLGVLLLAFSLWLAFGHQV
jgi:hypothetical protein